MSFVKKIFNSYNNRSNLDKFIIKALLLFTAWLIFSQIIESFIHFNAVLTKLLLNLSSFSISVFGYEVGIEKKILIINGVESAKIVTSCLAKRPMLVFTGFIIVYPGIIKPKLWYIPFGIVIIQFFNVIRISGLAVIFYHDPTKYDVYHNYIFKFIFYLIIFILWLIWIKRINKIKE